MAGARSLVWQYFVKTDENDLSPKCRTCQKEVKRDSGNTSNLRRHLQLKHVPKYQELIQQEEEKNRQEDEEHQVQKLFTLVIYLGAAAQTVTWALANGEMGEEAVRLCESPGVFHLLLFFSTIFLTFILLSFKLSSFLTPLIGTYLSLHNLIVNVWNSLPNRVVEAEPVDAFKRRLDKFWADQSIILDYKAELTGLTNRSKVYI